MLKTNTYAWLYLILIAPLQTVFVINNLARFFGSYTYLISLVLQTLLIILPVIWFLIVDKKKILWKLPKRSEIFTGFAVGTLFAALILAVYFLILKRYFSFDISNYSYFSKIHFFIVGLFISFFNAFSEEFNYRYMIFGKLKDLKLKDWQAFFLTGLIFSIHHILLVVNLSGLWFGVLTLLVLTCVSYIWSYFYKKYDSLYSPYFSHMIADLALFVVGFDALFN